MLKMSKRLFFATLLMCSLLFMSVSNFAYAEEKKSGTEKTETTTDKKPIAEPPSGPNVKGEKKEEGVEVQTPASVNGKKVDGTGTVTDFTTSGSKAFYTITDKDSNVFYLIVDLDKTQNNVYFLSDVKKTALDGSTTTAGKDGGNVKPNIPNQKQTEAEKTTANTNSASEQPKKESNNNTFLLIVFLVAAIGVTLYYFLVIKKKKNKPKTNEDEEAMEDDIYEDNFEDERNKNNKED
ncbi:CD1107 family mobile element protein [Bacillus pseudomycoides]|uniref:CD1107 family mobile element protein n=1 Tax=Bacillus pseudomycoides TaxID=64104 RepID=UPI000BF31389|nr:DUF4366 domain-containing protein [Bacillus pseudomycoides]PGC41174.1 hypothetical protein COM18_11600 [Bacillus pseudomycoides]